MPNYKTDNLLVTDNRIAFCITRKAIDDNVWRDMISACIDAILALSEAQISAIVAGTPIVSPEARIEAS